MAPVACYRLMFQNDQAYCVEIDADPSARGSHRSHRATLYRVRDDIRESSPMTKGDGRPIAIYAASEDVVLGIACDVLTADASGRLQFFAKCATAMTVQRASVC